MHGEKNGGKEMAKKLKAETTAEKIKSFFKKKPCECHPVLKEYDKCPVCHKSERHGRIFALSMVILGVLVAVSWLTPYTRDKIETVRNSNRCDLRYLTKRAKSGNIPAQMELVRRYTTECFSIAFSTKHKNYWLHKSAQEGNYAPAQYQLAILYSIGEGVPRNYKEGMKWLKFSAEQEYMPAQYELAKTYKKGSLFVKSNPQKFLFWLTKAGHNGSDRAAEELGYLFEKGIFVSQSDIEAYKWYSLSTNKDSYKLDMLELKMTKKEIEQAQREASALYKVVFKKINEK